MTTLDSLIPQSINSLFDLMGIAEEEIQSGIERYPNHKELIWGMFSGLYPPEVLRYYPVLYRSHCRTQIERTVNNEDTDEPTPAMFCAVFSDLSAQAPLRVDVMVAYWQCFKAALPETAQEMAKKDDKLHNIAESYPGASNEVLTTIKRKLVRTTRTNKEP